MCQKGTIYFRKIKIHQVGVSLIMRERFERFMRGRYGVDHFSHFIVVCALVIMLLQIIFPYNYAKAFLNVLAIAMLAYAYFRIFSRNHYKRYEENMRYMKDRGMVVDFFRTQKLRFRQRKTHRIFSCPNCSQKIRVPSGKGKIAITCPKCRKEFIRRS